jgi:membrane protein
MPWIMNAKQPTIISLVLEAVRRLFADEAIPLAGNIAFRTLFSIFPFLIFLTALAGFFGNEALAEKVVTFLLSVAPEQLVHPLASEIRSILTVPRTGLLSLAAVLTIWSAMAGVDSIRVGLNRAYDLKENRNLFWLYGQSILFVIGSAIGLLAIALLLVFAPVALAALDRFAPDFKQNFTTLNQLRYPIAIALLTGGLQLSHRILPAKQQKGLAVLPGVLLTVIVWVALSSLFSYYLVNFNTFASTYSSLSGLFAAMFFLYLAALEPRIVRASNFTFGAEACGTRCRPITPSGRRKQSRLKSPDRQKSQSGKERQYECLGNNEWRLRLGRCERLQESKFLKRLNDEDEYIEIERDNGRHDIDPAPCALKMKNVIAEYRACKQNQRNDADNAWRINAERWNGKTRNTRQHREGQKYRRPASEFSVAQHAPHHDQSG